MNCDICNKTILKDMFSALAQCNSNDHMFSLSDSGTKFMIIYNSDRSKAITFHNFIYIKQNYIEDFSVFKNKTFEEIELMYNKLEIFK